MLSEIGVFAEETWGNPLIPDRLKRVDFAKLALRAQAEIQAGKTKARKMIRIAGQSGSGKSSILFPAALESLLASGVDPVHIAVREFAKYHPFYDEIKAGYGAENIRENTNAFAFTLLAHTIARLMREGFDILHEVTLCGAPFENFWAGLLRENNYETEVHVVAMPKAVSDNLIAERALGNGAEAGRKVTAASADFFYRILPGSLEILRRELPGGGIIIWSATEAEPVFEGKRGEAEALAVLEKYQNAEAYAIMSKEIILGARRAWFNERRPS